MPEPGADLLDLGVALSEEGKRRFPRWDDSLWIALLEGPAAAYDRRLRQTSLKTPKVDALARSYLGLLAEGVGAGYLYPPGAGRENFFSRAFTELIPDHLPGLAPDRQAEILAACWNLGENLEQGPPWLERIFLAIAGDLDGLDHLETLVARVSAEVFKDPPAELAVGAFAAHWLHLPGTDGRFMPGRVAFLAPTVVAVTDRRKDMDGNPLACLGAWLRDDPVALGPLPAEKIERAPRGKDPFYAALKGRDPRVTPKYSGARNPWRACYTLKTSQFLVVLTPARQG